MGAGEEDFVVSAPVACYHHHLSGMMKYSETWEGRRIGGFPLEKYLGGSEHSAVFLTHSDDLPRAAIKIFLKNDSPEDVSALSHPHLVRIFAMGECELDGMAMRYAVMEHAEEDLSQVLPNRPLTPDEAKDILRPALDALAYLHGRGLAHGHLKPSNFLAVDDQLKLSSDRVSRGAASDDVFALGLMLVEALTQRRPSPQQPVVPRSVPDPFYDIARGALHEDPDRRWTLERIAKCLDSSSSRVLRYSIAAVGIALVGLLAWQGKDLVRGNKPGANPPVATVTPSVAPPVPATAPPTESAPAPIVEKPARPIVTKQQLPPDSKPVDKPVDKKEEPAPEPEKPVSASHRTPAASGDILEQPEPSIEDAARKTIHGRVTVILNVNVDPSGAVSSVKAASKASRYFTKRASDAVSHWKFKASSEPQHWRVVLQFLTSDTQVFADRVTP